MRASLLLVPLLLAGCHGGSRPSDSARDVGFAPMDSAMAHRICEAPDSVVAGTKACVLRDQGRRAEGRRPEERPTAPAPQP